MNIYDFYNHVHDFVLKPLGRVEQGSHPCRKAVWLGILGTKQGGESVHGSGEQPGVKSQSSNRMNRVVICGRVGGYQRQSRKGHPHRSKVCVRLRSSIWVVPDTGS